MKKIKILHIYTVMNRGGAETFIMNVFRNIDRNKYQFDFLCTSSIKGDYEDEIVSLGGNVIHYSDYDKKRVLKTIVDIKKIIKENGPYDVIHTQSQFYSGLLCFIAWVSKIKKRIVHSHSASDKDNNSIKRKIYFYFMKILINMFATDKIACGKKAGDFLFGEKSKYKIIYNGIDIDNFTYTDRKKINELKKKYNLREKQIIIGHVGRFVKLKNHDYFIKIIKELNKRRINFKFVLVGNGEYQEEFKRKTILENVNDKFIFAGLQKETNLYYSLFDVLVMPSIYEGFPVSVIESLACGTPCVLSNTITDEVNIIEKKCSFLDLNENVTKWCDEIIKLASAKKDKKNCNILLHQRGFDISNTVLEISDLYSN